MIDTENMKKPHLYRLTRYTKMFQNEKCMIKTVDEIWESFITDLC